MAPPAPALPPAPVATGVERLTMPEFDVVVYPAVPGPWMVVALELDGFNVLQQYALAPLRKAESLQLTMEGNARYALSPGGDLVIRTAKRPREAIEFWSFKQQHRLRAIETKVAGIDLVGFISRTQFLVRPVRAGDGAGVLEVWDALSGSKLREFPVPAYDARNPYTPIATAISPDGKLLAIVTDKDGPPRVAFFDLPLGRRRGETPLAGLAKGAVCAPAGVAFSPDGTRVVLACDLAKGSRVVAWAAATGRQLVSHDYPDGLRPLMTDEANYSRRVLDWLGNGPTLLVYGVGFLDLESGKPIGKLAETGVKGQHVIDRTTVHLIYQTPDKKELGVVKLGGVK